MRDAFERYIARSLAEEIDDIPGYYAAKDGAFHVATLGGALVGMFGLERVDAETMELRRMYVADAARGRGLGRLLLRHAEAECMKAGCRRLTLSTSEVQRAALALYRGAGYRLVREEIATAASNKTVGANIRRFAFEKIME